jgi:dienelactone hydrolase
VSAEPTAVQTVQVAIDAFTSPEVMPFWRALLGYQEKGPEGLVDPHGRGPSIWFQDMDAPRPQRNRSHVDISVPHGLTIDRTHWINLYFRSVRFLVREQRSAEMAEVVLFHHAQGLTPGVVAFAEELRRAGHAVHTPDLFEGRTFETLEAGLDYVKEVGFGEMVDRGVRAAEDLPADLVYAGFSLGVVPAQRLAQTRAGARGALLLYSCVPASEFGAWPSGVPVQVHAMDADPFFVDDGDIDAARALVDEATDAELFLYPGEQHLFADSSLPAYDADASALLTQRVLDFLGAR